MLTNIGYYPIINTSLLAVLMVMFIVYGYRMNKFSDLYDRINALQLRITVQEKVSPCAHCRNEHGGHGVKHDCDK
jgi:regulatory protein YycH of two-component signal transduction system YycFG